MGRLLTGYLKGAIWSDSCRTEGAGYEFFPRFFPCIFLCDFFHFLVFFSCALRAPLRRAGSFDPPFPPVSGAGRGIFLARSWQKRRATQVQGRKTHPYCPALGVFTHCWGACVVLLAQRARQTSVLRSWCVGMAAAPGAAAAAAAQAEFCACGLCPNDIREKVCCHSPPWAAKSPVNGCVTETPRFVAHLQDDSGRMQRTGKRVPRPSALSRRGFTDRVRFCRAASTFRQNTVAAATAAGKVVPAKTTASAMRMALYNGFTHAWGPGDKVKRPLPCCVLKAIRDAYPDEGSAMTPASGPDAPGKRARTARLAQPMRHAHLIAVRRDHPASSAREWPAGILVGAETT